MDKTTLLRAFNTLFFEFFDDIIQILPENADIPASRTSMDTIKRANPTAILKAWFNFVYTPYAEVIDAGNISFFFDKNYASDLAHLSNAKQIMEIIDTIRNPIKNMSDVNKAHCTKYIQNLCKLSSMYMKLNGGK